MTDKQTKIAAKSREEHMEDALFREVNEEVRAQQAYDFVKKHARPLIFVAAAALIIVIGFQLTRWHNSAARMDSAAQYESAVMMAGSGNPRAAAEALSRAAKKSRGGMADLALFEAARIDLQTGDKVAAVTRLERLADGGATRDFRDLATLHLAVLNAEEMTPREFEQFMAPLQTKRSPFYFTGLLLVAQKYLAANDLDSARIWLDRISSDKDAPASIVAEADMLR